jgi:hypothetical protein
MRADEKIDPELELEAEHDLAHELEEEQEPAEERVEEVDVSQLHFFEIAAYLEELLHGRGGDPNVLAHVNDLERAGLELITAAVQGRSAGSSRSILAEDRLMMLNQALAALQPVLATGFEGATQEMRAIYDQVAFDVAELARSLSSLSDAQEEMFLQETMRLLGEAPEEDDKGKPEDKGKPGLLGRIFGKKPKPAPIEQGEVGDERPSMLDGPGPAVEKPVAPSALTGPGPAVEKPAAPSALTGPGPAVEKPAPPSTLAGPGEAPAKKPQPSTAWDGDEPRR